MKVKLFISMEKSLRKCGSARLKRDNWGGWWFAGTSCCRMKVYRSYGNRSSGAVKVKASTISLYQYKAGLSKGILLEHKSRHRFHSLFQLQWFLLQGLKIPVCYQKWCFLWTCFFFQLSFSAGFIISMTPLQDLQMDTLITAELLKWVMFLTSLLWCHW